MVEVEVVAGKAGCSAVCRLSDFEQYDQKTQKKHTRIWVSGTVVRAELKDATRALKMLEKAWY